MPFYSRPGFPEVSVLMSCHNGGTWLREAIDSVLMQTFVDFELILIDDGSTDNTWDIIKSYALLDGRIIAISKTNTGLADSLNVGLAKARGVWIARLDQDDLCEPTRLSEQINFVRNNDGVVLLGAGFHEIDETGQIVMTHTYPTGHRRLTRHLERSQRFFPHSSAFFRVEIARLVGGYNLRIHRADDWRLWLELSLRGKIASIPKALVRIRKHANQMSLDGNGRMQLCDAIASSSCHFLRKAGFEDPSVGGNKDEWIYFRGWVESKVDDEGIFERRSTWSSARAIYISSGDVVTGAVGFIRYILKSGHAYMLIWEKLFGSSFPKKLARQWQVENKLSNDK